MDGELVSVIIPVYNVEKYLTACVESVINSDYNNLEIILVDDGATDSCPEMCDELAKKDQRIIVIHKENGGLSSARNAGLDVAKGKYVTFVDSDDIITDNMISNMYQIAEKEQCDVVKIGIIATTNESKLFSCTEEYEIIDKKTALNKIFDPSCTLSYYITICGKLYKSSLFDELRFPLGIIHEDEYLTPRLLYKSDRIAICNDIGYLYMQRPGVSITRGDFYPGRLVVLDIFEDRVALFKKWGYTDLAEIANRRYFSLLIYWYKNIDKKKYKKEYIGIKKTIRRFDHNTLCLEHKLRRLAIIFGIFYIADRILNKVGL